MTQNRIPTAAGKWPPRVSIIIPSYNRGQFLLEALESVFAQTCQDFDVIVVDDGSTDDTAQRIEPYLGRIQFHQQPNRGVASARNYGLQHAQGEFICFLDSDDLWMPTKLEEQIKFADLNRRYTLIATEIEGFDESGRVAGRGKQDMYSIRNGFVLEQLLLSNWIQTSTVMVRRDALLTTGGFDEDVGSFGEDWLLWMRIAAKFQIYFLPKPLVRYRVHTENLTSHFPELQFRSLMLILDKLTMFSALQAKEKLLNKARYRIAVGRGWKDLRVSSYDHAIEKLHVARAAVGFPMKAWALLLCAYAMRRMIPRQNNVK